MPQTQLSIHCNACHDPEQCPQCIALNAERDAQFGRSVSAPLMSRDEIAAIVERIVADQVDAAFHHDVVVPAVAHDLSLLDLGLDELSTVEILMHAEEAFGVELPDDDVTLTSTVADIAAVVAGALRKRSERLP